MIIVFRTDSSLLIGTGHVMRCLTLADTLTSKGVECHFICRAHQGNLIAFINKKGYIVHKLPIDSGATKVLRQSNQEGEAKSKEHFSQQEWLGSTQIEDAHACISILKSMNPDWLIVDHYGLDATWEHLLSKHCHKLMVIDDLANRYHFCNFLLDQTLGRKTTDYSLLVPENCYLLCGPEYALLRPEFSALRSYSLERRRLPHLRHLLISMGGGDGDNITGKVLQALQHSSLNVDCKITVVMGPNAIWLNEVNQVAYNMLWPVQILMGVNNMAHLLADSDLSIGAAGTTSWERCCLGVPTLMFILAENQRKIGIELANLGAAKLIEVSRLSSGSPFISEYWKSSTIDAMSKISASITDGMGSTRLVKLITNEV